MRDVAFATQTLGVGTHEQNSLSLADAEIMSGCEAELTLTLQNESAISFLEVLLLLPEGIDVVGDSWRVLSNESAFAVSTTAEADGLRIRCAASTDGEAWPANVGAVLAFKVKADRYALGSKSLRLTEIVVGRPQLTDHRLADVASTLDVSRTYAGQVVLSASEAKLYVTETAQLTATVLPAAAIPDVMWGSSDEHVATVSADGLVTALNDGSATITATAADGSDAKAECRISVTTRAGDANSDNRITIADAVAIANYIVGIENARFSLIGADANGDGIVTIADAVSTIDLVLSQPAATASDDALISAGMMQIDDFEVIDGCGTLTIRLDNSADLTALQTDLILPQGVTVVGADVAGGLTTHTAQLRDVEQGVCRVVLFSAESAPLAAGSASGLAFASDATPVLTLTLRADNTFSEGAVAARRPIAASLAAADRILSATAGYGKVVTSLGAIDIDAVRIIASQGRISVSGAEGHTVGIADPTGRQLAHVAKATDSESFPLPPGIYLVQVDDAVRKVVLR